MRLIVERLVAPEYIPVPHDLVALHRARKPRRVVLVPREIVFLGVVGTLLSVITPNPLLTAVGLITLLLVFVLLWRVDEPPTLLFAVGFQWLQVFVPVIGANFSGLALAESDLPFLDEAAYLGLIAILTLAFGMRIGRGNRPLNVQAAAVQERQFLTVRSVTVSYLAAQVISLGAEVVGWRFPGLRQPLLPLELMRWSIVFIALWAGLTDRRFRQLAAILLLLEVMIGLMGFFASFRQVLFVGVVAAMWTTPSARKLLQPKLVLLICLTLPIFIFWQAVKGDYRRFLNQDTGFQVVLVSYPARVSFLLQRVTSMSLSDVQKGLESGAERMGYLEFFGRSMSVVPERIRHQDGRLWGEAIAHVFAPRLFFPDKPDINDSDRVNEFSGIEVAGADQGTSFSLGYVTESYIDFGPVFMFLPIFTVGIFWGWAYRRLARTGKSRLLSVGFAVAFILSGALAFEMSNMKLVGGAITALLVGWFLLKFFSPQIARVLFQGRLHHAHR